MRRRDAIALVSNNQHRPGSVATHLDFDSAALVIAPVADCVADQIVGQLQQLSKVAGDRRQILIDFRRDPAAAPVEQGCGILNRNPRDFGEVDLLFRRPEPVRLNSRQTHQVLDDPQHAAGLDLNGCAETRTHFLVDWAIFGQRFGISNDGRQGCSKFMAGIGDKVRAHSLCRAQGRSIRQPDQHRASG